jgi:hypothetical protein
MHFVEDPVLWQPSDPDAGDVAQLRERFGMEITRAASFAVERRRGWSETDDTPQRDPEDGWDQRRPVAMWKEGPQGRELRVRGSFAAFRSMRNFRSEVRYELDLGELEGVQWADWSPDGHLLVATVDGRLQVRAPGGRAVGWEHDLSDSEPDPTPPPAEASSWVT